VTSFRIGDCNGTTHPGRMLRAANALRASPYYAARSPKGFDHFVVSTGCIEDNKRAAERFGGPLSTALSHAIVGRDRAYNAFYKASAVGRCTIETPYAANSALAVMSPPTAAPRRWLLSFHGSLNVCCEPGKSVRQAARALVGASNDTLVVHVTRSHIEARSQEEQQALYRAQARAMRQSRFCLVPAGDNEVSSRLYSAIAAGCVPVVIANQLSGAFASHVPYHQLWLRVEESAFRAAPYALLGRLRALTDSQLQARRAQMRAYAADVLYDVPRSRVAHNFLRVATTGCVRATPTSLLAIYPPSHKYSHDRNYGVNCSCVRRPPRFWWHAANHPRQLYSGRGRVPTELCRCLHCATLCPHETNTTMVAVEAMQAAASAATLPPPPRMVHRSRGGAAGPMGDGSAASGRRTGNSGKAVGKGSGKVAKRIQGLA